MIQPHEILTISERREQVLATLQPDRIRNHQVSEGIQLTDEQLRQLDDISDTVRSVVQGLQELSGRALAADNKDPLQRKVREMLKLESLFQHNLREGLPAPELPAPQITKVDTILTDDGIKIVEIEPGKVRGLGYGAMVRAQSTASIGNGTGLTIGDLSQDQPVVLVMSGKDRFHQPEMNLLAQHMPNLVVAPQSEIINSEEGLRLRSGVHLPRLAIMMSTLNNGGVSESDIRSTLSIISDRRPDMEAKTALALLHNGLHDEEVEELLRDVFGEKELKAIRAHIPLTAHSSLLEKGDAKTLADEVTSGDTAVFLKPINDSGTRGIVTPGNPVEVARILNTPKELKKFVVQRALPVVMQKMKTLDVLDGHEGDAEMNVRITLHVDASGAIIEASAVGSPDSHLAHGGKESVITSVERTV